MYKIYAYNYFFSKHYNNNNTIFVNKGKKEKFINSHNFKL